MSTDRATEQQQTSVLPNIRRRPPRSDLLIKDRRPAGSIWQQKRKWNNRYRDRLIEAGIPSRRDVAESVMQVLFEEMDDDGLLARPHVLPKAMSKAVLAETIAILLSVVDKKTGQPKFTAAGIKTRVGQIATDIAATMRAQDSRSS